MGTVAEKLEYLKETKKVIGDAIVAKGGSVSESDTFRSYGDKILGLSGGGETTKFNLSINDMFGDIISGMLGKPQGGGITISFIGVNEIGEYALASKFRNNEKISAIKFPDLSGINGDYACAAAFADIQTGVYVEVSTEFMNIFGVNACESMFKNTPIISEGLPIMNVKNIDGDYVCANMFNGSQLNGVFVWDVETIIGINACRYMFANNPGITEFHFGMLAQAEGMGVFNNMFYKCTGLTKIVFPTAMQETIESMSDYANKFGATNAEIVFE